MMNHIQLCESLIDKGLIRNTLFQQVGEILFVYKAAENPRIYIYALKSSNKLAIMDMNNRGFSLEKIWMDIPEKLRLALSFNLDLLAN